MSQQNFGSCYAEDGRAWDGREELPWFDISSEEDAARVRHAAELLDSERPDLANRYRAMLAAYEQQNSNQQNS